jgi:arylsulfatase A-like enzyme
MLLTACPPTCAAAENPKNVIWMLNDQENAKPWFPSGWISKNLPLFNKLASNGMKFNKAFTCSNMCSSARASMFTGLYNGQHQSTLTLTSAK